MVRNFVENRTSHLAADCGLIVWRTYAQYGAAEYRNLVRGNKPVMYAPLREGDAFIQSQKKAAVPDTRSVHLVSTGPIGNRNRQIVDHRPKLIGNRRQRFLNKVFKSFERDHFPAETGEIASAFRKGPLPFLIAFYHSSPVQSTSRRSADAALIQRRLWQRRHVLATV